MMMNERSICVLPWAVVGLLSADVCAQNISQPSSAPQDAAAPNTAPVRLAPGDLESLAFAGGDPEDYGQRPVGSPVLRRVNFRNMKPVHVRVEVLQKSCGCLAAGFDRDIVPAGERCALSMGATVSPSAGQQVHFVLFRTKWEENGESREERGICYLRFFPDVSFIVRPERAGLAGPEKGRIEFEMSVLTMKDADVSLMLPTPDVNLPGWTASRVPGQPGSDPRVAMFRVSGPVGTSAIQDGMVTWQAQDSLPAASMPFRIFAQPEYRVFPGGALFRNPPRDRGVIASVRVFSPPGASGVAKARVFPEFEWLAVRMLSENTVEVRLAPSDSRPLQGATRGELLNAVGEPLVSFPIVWWSDAEPGS